MMTAYTRHLLLMSLSFTVLQTIPAPVNFTIISHNFKHILQWSPGINSPPQTVFNLKQRCGKRKTVHLNIRNTTVDVSQSLEDIYTPCVFIVWASLDNITSSRIKKQIAPYEDTIIGPPNVFLSGCGNCLNISISLPDESGKTDQLHQFYNTLSFIISWKKDGQNEARKISISSKQYVLQNLQRGDRYCVRVLPQIRSNNNTQPSSWQCEYTSKEEPRGVLYLLSWSLGATVSGIGVLLLAQSLVYTEYLCKPKTRLPKSLSNIDKAYYLNPEQTLFKSVSLTQVELFVSKNNPSKNNNPLNVKEDSENKRNEEDDDYVYKADKKEDCGDEDEGNCIYMSCEIDHSGWDTNNIQEKSIVSTLPLHNSSGIYYTKKAAIEQIYCDELECKKELISEVSEDKNRHPEVKIMLKSEGNDGSSEDTSGNINLFSVTLRALGPEDDLEEEEVCKPLLPKSVDTRNEQDTASGYMVTHSGNMHQ